MLFHYAQHVVCALALNRFLIHLRVRTCFLSTEIYKFVCCLTQHVVHFIAGTRPVWIVVAVEEVSRHITGCEWSTGLMKRSFTANTCSGSGEGFCYQWLLKCRHHCITLVLSHVSTLRIILPFIIVLLIIHHSSIFASSSSFWGSSLPYPPILHF